MKPDTPPPRPWGIADKAPSGLRDWLQGSRGCRGEQSSVLGSMSTQALGSHWASGPPPAPSRAPAGSSQPPGLLPQVVGRGLQAPHLPWCRASLGGASETEKRRGSWPSVWKRVPGSWQRRARTGPLQGGPPARKSGSLQPARPVVLKFR